MDISADTSISLQISNGARFNVRLLGVVPDAYIALRDIPTRHGLMEVTLGYGDVVVLRYLYEGKVIGFRSYVLNAVREPERLLFVAFPREVQEHSLRQADRVKCTFPCQLSLHGERHAGLIADLSETGCQCVIRRRLDVKLDDDSQIVGQQVELEVVGLGGQQIRLRGLIRRSAQDDQALRIGVQFEQPQPALFAEVLDALRPLSE